MKYEKHFEDFEISIDESDDLIRFINTSAIIGDRRGYFMVREDAIPANVLRHCGSWRKASGAYSYSADDDAPRWHPVHLSSVTISSKRELAYTFSISRSFETGGGLSPDERREVGTSVEVVSYPILSGTLPLREEDCTPFERGKDVSHAFLWNGIRFEAKMGNPRFSKVMGKWCFDAEDILRRVGRDVPVSVLPDGITPSMIAEERWCGDFIWDEGVFVPDAEAVKDWQQRLLGRVRRLNAIHIGDEDYHFPIIVDRSRLGSKKGVALVNGKKFPVQYKWTVVDKEGWWELVV